MGEIAFIEPFDLYPSISAAGVGMTSYWNFNSTDGASLVAGLLGGVGQAFQYNVSIQASPIQHLRAIPQTKQLSLAFYYRTTVPTGVSKAFIFKTALNVTQCYLQFTPAGVMQIVGEGGTVYGTGTFQWGDDVVNHVSLVLDIETPGANTFAMYINGSDVPDISVSGADLQDDGNAFIGIIDVYGTLGTALNEWRRYTIDHMICLYDSTEIIPELELYYLGPQSDDSVDWTRLSGASNKEMIDEALIDSDTTYNSSNTPGDKDKFVVTDLPFVPDYVWCVSSATTAKKEESATQSLTTFLDVGGVEYPNDEIFLSTTYTIYYQHNRLNPDTGLAWDPADISGVKSGYELTTGS